MKLYELLKEIPVLETTADLEQDITGVSYDSRKVEPGHLFVAVTGYAADGHRFIPMAAQKGAVCVLCQQAPETDIPYIRVADTRAALAVLGANWFGRPAEHMTVIGVTGTNGKTTSTFLLKQVLEQVLNAKVGLIGTIQNMIGNEVLPTERTTPESFELQGLFAQMLAKGCTHVVMEVSSHALYLHRVDCIPFAVGAFTNLTEDHLDFHKTMEAYRLAKALLFTRCRVGVFNIDDPMVEKTIPESSCSVLTTSQDPAKRPTLLAEHAALEADHVCFELRYAGGSCPVRLGIPGGFTVYNALTVLGCAAALGLDLKAAAQALGAAKSVKGRVEVVPTPGQPYTVLIDYAHTPDALENVLRSVKGFCKGRVIAVFGCGGDRDPIKRPIMGRIGVELADLAIITSDNPRTEDPGKIIEDILQGVKDAGKPYLVRVNRRSAIAEAMAQAGKDDIIVLCGKGHETYQILGTQKLHLDEREVVAEQLAGLSLKQAAQWCCGTVLPEFEDCRFRGARADSRLIAPGQLFVALQGARDGHDFIPAAMEHHAAAVLGTRLLPGVPMIAAEDSLKALGDIARAYRETAAARVRVVGVTGSVGKTTTKEMIACALSTRLFTQKTEKNFNNNIGLPMTVLDLFPEAEAAVIEMGMNHFGEISYLTGIAKPNVAVITNIGTMHIENLGSRAGICKAKLEILEGLAPDGTVILNGDEPLLRSAVTNRKTLYFGLGPDCDLTAKDIENTAEGIRFTAVGLGRELEVRLPVEGRHNVYNALAALLTAHCLGVAPELAAAGLRSFSNTGDRQNIYQKNGCTVIADCYNAGPESMAAALSVLRQRSAQAGRRIAVLGDMLELGDHGPEAHRTVGRLAAESADLVLTYGPLSRLTAEAAGDKGRHFDSRETLLAALRQTVVPGDVLLFKASHGMHLEKVLEDFFQTKNSK